MIEMITDCTKLLTQIAGLSRLVTRTRAKQVVNLFQHRINFRDLAILSEE